MNRKTPLSCFFHPSCLARRGVVVAAILACVAVQLPAAGVPTTCPLFTPFEGYEPESGARCLRLADFDGDGDLDAASLSERGIQVLFNHGNGTMEIGPEPNQGGNPIDGVTADFDSDGDLDIAAADYSSTHVLIYLNSGHGDFSLGFTYSVGMRLEAIKAGDMDGDGDVDLVVRGDNVPPRLIILTNNGDGSFGTSSIIPIGDHTAGPVLGDLDGDTDIDIVVEFRDLNSTATIRACFNHGDGTFGDVVGIWTVVEDYPFLAEYHRMAGSDLDGDGDFDVALTTSQSRVFVFRNHGDGTFASPDEYPIGASTSYPPPIRLGDFNGDSQSDIMVLSVPVFNQVLLTNKGDGVFSLPESVELKAYNRNDPYGVEVGDLDGDGDLDLFSTHPTTVFFNYGDGRFHSGRSGLSVPFEGRDYFTYVTMGDFTGDDLPDFAAVGDHSVSFSVSHNLGNGIILPAGTYPTTGTIHGIFAVDLNRDGFDDIALLGGNPSQVSVWMNRNDGTFLEGPKTRLGSAGGVRLCEGDFNGDGLQDLAVPDYQDGSVRLLLNTGGGDFTISAHAVADSKVIDLFPADLDGDGDLDMVVYVDQNYESRYPYVVVLANQGDGTFVRGEEYLFSKAPHWIAGGDFDGDGDVDLVESDYYYGIIRVFFNRGDATFETPVVYPMRRGGTQIHAEDLDLDGDLDLVLMPVSSSPFVEDGGVWLNRGDGQFELFESYALHGDLVRSILLGDVDGDGDPDVVTDKLKILYNLHSTNCTFTPFSGFMMR